MTRIKHLRPGPAASCYSHSNGRHASRKGRPMRGAPRRHWAKDYRAPRKEQADLTRDGDEESLLMARVCELTVDPTPPLKGGLHCHELEAHVFLGSDSDDEHKKG
jgi:hypothetical protein